MSGILYRIYRIQFSFNWILKVTKRRTRRCTNINNSFEYELLCYFSRDFCCLLSNFDNVESFKRWKDLTFKYFVCLLVFQLRCVGGKQDFDSWDTKSDYSFLTGDFVGWFYLAFTNLQFSLINNNLKWKKKTKKIHINLVHSKLKKTNCILNKKRVHLKEWFTKRDKFQWKKPIHMFYSQDPK